MQNHAFIIDAVRTSVGKLKGGLSSLRADDLLAHVIKNLILKFPNLDPASIDDVIIGCANQAGEDNRNVARMASLLAGLPTSVPGETINRLCASGMSAIIQCCRAIGSGDGELFLAGGVEHMTRSPLVMSKSAQPWAGDIQLFDSSFGWRFVNPLMHQIYGTDAMGVTAENLVDKYSISREDQDKFALWSQMKASKAQSDGRFVSEISPVTIKGRGKETIFEFDEFIKPDTTAEILSTLRPAFRNEGGTVTAGNASGLNDGAAAMLIASEAYVEKHQLSPKARYISSAVVGVEPRIMGIGPVEATRKALAKANLTLDQMDIIEINEAFAAQVLACTRQLGMADDDERLNPNGGGIAIGHPLGMSGTRIIQTATEQLVLTGKKYALVTMCVGVGQGFATIIERV